MAAMELRFPLHFTALNLCVTVTEHNVLAQNEMMHACFVSTVFNLSCSLLSVVVAIHVNFSCMQGAADVANRGAIPTSQGQS
ncbi:hypothetical protein COLO4_15638 [Corchorus olitorius]|uniref:Uncharacterized protein n=1 Tax=Corchorus olitorius TaxID=93759 RepID=A0A1R3JLY5_9ROSI|nr:hypothetical protein COLO4_15638 [Corchorus olitorius]